MKEAAGEANLTVVAIILIAVVVSKRSCCSDFGGVWNSGKCQVVDGNGTYTDKAESTYYDSAKKTCKGANN